MPREHRIEPLALRFAKFHAANPSVYRELRAMARQLKRAGETRVSFAMLWEAMRFRGIVATPGKRAKVKPPIYNNNHRAFYARELMRRERDLRGLFEVRASEADGGKRQ